MLKVKASRKNVCSDPRIQLRGEPGHSCQSGSKEREKTIYCKVGEENGLKKQKTRDLLPQVSMYMQDVELKMEVSGFGDWVGVGTLH